MGEFDRDEPFKSGRQLMDAFGRQIESEEFDSNETARLRLIRAEDRPQCARPDLMKHTKGPESVGRRSAGSIRIQRWYSSKEGT